MLESPKISIITVVYNSELFIEKTIKSVLDQTYTNVEYIIIDGGSKDHTLEIIEKYKTKLSYWISEPDKGLYDAMNKGLRQATGDYVWFINSGDEVFDAKTVEQVFSNHTNADVYYGETMIIDENNNPIGDRRLKPPSQLNWKSFKKGMVVSHQSIIIKRTIVSEYDMQYKFSADFNWVLQALKKAQTIVHTQLYLSKFLDGGLTKSNIVPGLKERFRIMRKNYGLCSTLIMHIPIGIKFLFFVFKNKRF